MKNHYQTLGIAENASPEEIKKKFRKLALQFHPDRNPGAEAERKFKEINEAYAVLSDSSQRQKYDSQRRNPFGQGFEGAGFGDVWSDFFGDFGDIFGRQAQQNQRRSQQQSPNIRFEIPLDRLVDGPIETSFSRDEIVTCVSCNGIGGHNPKVCQVCKGSGVVNIVHQAGSMRIQTSAPCQKCSGRGRTFESPCKTCNGTGQTKNRKNYKVTITTEIGE